MMLKSKTPITAAEADLAALEKRRAALDARRVTASEALSTATAARRRLLVEADDPDPKALAASDRACREAADAEIAAADAVGALDRSIADARARLDELRDVENRERQAVAFETSAKAADAAIDRIKKAAGELDSARRDLVAALLPGAAACYAPPANAVEFGPTYLTRASFYDHRGDPVLDDLSVEQVATRVAGHLVTVALPGLGIVRLEDAQQRKADGQPTGVLAPVDGEAARTLLTDPMRAAAARAREGLPAPTLLGAKAPRRMASRWTTDAEGRCFDDAGVPVTTAGFYLDTSSEAA